MARTPSPRSRDSGALDDHGHAAARAYEWIRAQILAGRWCDGAPLKEGELARDIGVSRTPVREALRRLTLEGLTETVPNLGSRLRSWTPESLDEIFALRLLLEPHAAFLAATRATPQQIDALRVLCDEMHALLARGPRSAQRLRTLAELNHRFHCTLLAAAQSPLLQKLAQQMIVLLLVQHTFANYDDAETARSVSQHRELLDALAARDALWAQSAMRAHLSAGKHAARRKTPSPAAAAKGA